ncbi:nucleotide-binding universal stress UspA family protein [Dokdonia sp. Hel_I_63]|uniref:universal stress protein n=1 Tax=Dokdonia sp. Hel_I_63 TaxID=1249996 RepID=UPI00119BFBFA|nr:universal stress protein [Dokdonia sp. Hel_I_63]TVZ21648.1 nucleotide-binding universal stress UspA family protein [Dokdonia sp. Hel_I_63]
MKNILVPTDFSDNCDKAAKLAIKIATLFKSEIHFLHQLHTPVDWVKLDKEKESNYPDTLAAIGDAKSKLRALDMEAEHRGLKSRTFLQFVSDNQAIVEHSHDFHHDFIVTGSKGIQKEFLSKLLGSNAQKIIRNTRVPILVVKENEVIFPFKNIAFVSDFKEDISNAFKTVEEISKKCNSKIHLLNINTTTDFNSVEDGLEPIKDFIKHFPNLENYQMHVYSETNVESGIQKFEESIDVDLIVMYTHSRKGLSSMFSKSIAEDVTNHSKKPVMTVHL